MFILQVLAVLSFSALIVRRQQAFISIELSKPTSKITHLRATIKSFTLIFELNQMMVTSILHVARLNIFIDHI
jgi:hypothetical protein